MINASQVLDGVSATCCIQLCSRLVTRRNRHWSASSPEVQPSTTVGMMAQHGAASTKYEQVHGAEWGWRKVPSDYLCWPCHSLLATATREMSVSWWVQHARCVLKRPRAGGEFFIKEQRPKHWVILLLLIQWCIPMLSTPASSHSPHSSVLTFRIYVPKSRRRQIGIWKRFPVREST